MSKLGIPVCLFRPKDFAELELLPSSHSNQLFGKFVVGVGLALPEAVGIQRKVVNGVAHLLVEGLSEFGHSLRAPAALPNKVGQKQRLFVFLLLLTRAALSFSICFEHPRIFHFVLAELKGVGLGSG